MRLPSKAEYSANLFKDKEFKKPSLEKLKEAQATLKKIHEKEPSDEVLEIIDLTKMDKDEICHIKCKQRKELQEIIQQIQEEKDALRAENKLLKECVEFYADPLTYTYDKRIQDFPIDAFGSKKARQTLVKIKGDN